MSQPQANTRGSTYILAGVAASLVDVVIAVVFALQPWRSCPEDDVAAGCVALPQDTAGLLLGVAALLVGLVLLAVGAARRRRQ